MSLRRIAETPWKDVLESASHTHRVLKRDPAGAYARMDFASRDLYRNAIGGLARHSRMSEAEIAETALAMSQAAQAASDGSRAAMRRAHIGYYLVDGDCRGLKPLSGTVPRLASASPAWWRRGRRSST